MKTTQATNETEMNGAVATSDLLKRCEDRWPGIRPDEIMPQIEQESHPCTDPRCNHQEGHQLKMVVLYVRASDAYYKRIAEERVANK